MAASSQPACERKIRWIIAIIIALETPMDITRRTLLQAGALLAATPAAAPAARPAPSDRIAVGVIGTGWKIISNPPVKFVRGNNTGCLPLPERDGNFELLKPLASGEAEENWIKKKGFILDAMKGYKPYLVLSVAGVQGSAKTSLC